MSPSEHVFDPRALEHAPAPAEVGERDADASLRPASFAEFVGQEQTLRNLQVGIEAASARGDVLDIDALAAVLDSGHLAGAGLDVFAEEPFASDHPIKACEQVVLTPHAADQTPEGIDLLNEGAVDNVIAFLEGNPRNNVAV